MGEPTWFHPMGIWKAIGRRARPALFLSEYNSLSICLLYIDDRTTVREYGNYWVKMVKEPSVSQNTVDHIRTRLERHIYPYIGEMKVRDVRAANIRHVMSECRHLCRGLQSEILSDMRNIFALAMDEDYLILRSPVPANLKPAGKSKPQVEPLTPEQEKEIIRVADSTKKLGPMVRLFLGTGLRRGELTGLMWSDIDWDRKTLDVRRHVVSDQKGKPHLEDGAKTTAGVRTVPLTDELITMLRGMQASSHSLYLFTTNRGTIYSAAALTKAWGTLNEKLSFHSHPHQLRHTYVTKLFEAGLDIKEIQRIVGHANPSITLEVYTHYRASVREESTLQRVREALA